MYYVQYFEVRESGYNIFKVNTTFCFVLAVNMYSWLVQFIIIIRV